MEVDTFRGRLELESYVINFTGVERCVGTAKVPESFVGPERGTRLVRDKKKGERGKVCDCYDFTLCCMICPFRSRVEENVIFRQIAGKA